jgi:hypothetical protein
VSEGRNYNQFLRRARELSKVQPRGPGRYWIDHQTLGARDIDRLVDARSLTLWNVKVPRGFFGDLPGLEFLDLRGGTANSLAPIASATHLRGLVINQVRGLTNLDEISGLVGLEILSLYGLAHVERLPSCKRLMHLRRAELGQMRSLTDLAGLAEAPGLKELLFSRKLPIDIKSVEPFRRHPTLRAFDWFLEDVPWSQAGPVMEALGHLGKATHLHPDEWLAKQRNDSP